MIQTGEQKIPELLEEEKDTIDLRIFSKHG
jgi:hypothetical protein